MCHANQIENRLATLRSVNIEGKPIGPVRRWLERLQRWQQLRHERLQLWSLSDAALKDIGLSRADVEREASRPFWDDRGWER